MGKWKCKKCGEEVRALSEVEVCDTSLVYYPILKNGKVDIDNLDEEERDEVLESASMNIASTGYINFIKEEEYECRECGETSNNLNDIAIWDEE